MRTGKDTRLSGFNDVPGLAHLLQDLIDSVPSHIFLKDRENRFLLVNRFTACFPKPGKESDSHVDKG
jgi:hypothetical protein